MRVPGGAVHDGLGDDRLGHGARAIGDCQGGGLAISKLACASLDIFLHLTYLSHGVGLGAVDDSGGSRAIGGVGSEHLSGVDDGVVSLGIMGRGTSCEGSDYGSGTHFDRLGGFVDF